MKKPHSRGSSNSKGGTYTEGTKDQLLRRGCVCDLIKLARYFSLKSCTRKFFLETCVRMIFFFLRITFFQLNERTLRGLFYFSTSRVHEFHWFKYACSKIVFQNHQLLPQKLKGPSPKSNHLAII